MNFSPKMHSIYLLRYPVLPHSLKINHQSTLTCIVLIWESLAPCFSLYFLLTLYSRYLQNTQIGKTFSEFCQQLKFICQADFWHVCSIWFLAHWETCCWLPRQLLSFCLQAGLADLQRQHFIRELLKAYLSFTDT